MSAAMLRRLERLERRRPTGAFWVDQLPIALRLLADAEAVSAGRAEWIPRYGPFPPMSEAAQDAFDRAVAVSDAMARRLAEGLK